MLKKIEKRTENKIVINAILHLNTFFKIEKTRRFDRKSLMESLINVHEKIKNQKPIQAFSR